jgi:hypothetical protein
LKTKTERGGEEREREKRKRRKGRERRKGEEAPANSHPDSAVSYEDFARVLRWLRVTVTR